MRLWGVRTAAMSCRTSSDGEDVGEPLLAGDAEPFEGGPVAWDGVGIEELDAAVGDAEGGGGEVAVVLEVEEIVAELRLGEAIGRGMEVVGELPDGAEVSVLGAVAEAGELEVLEHALAEGGGHGVVLSQREKKNGHCKEP